MNARQILHPLLIGLALTVAAPAPAATDNVPAASLSANSGVSPIQKARQAVADAARRGDLAAQFAALMELTKVELDMGTAHHALQTAFKARDLATAMGDGAAMTTCLRSIATAYQYDLRYDKAVEMARNILALAVAGQDTHAVHTARIFLMRQLTTSGQAEEALQMGRAMLDQAELRRDLMCAAQVHLALGHALLATEAPAEALKQFALAAPVLGSSGTAEERFDLVMGRALAHARLGDRRALVEQAHTAEVLLHKVNTWANRGRMMDVRFEMAAAQERWSDAMNIMRAIRARSDSVQVARMRAHYQSLQRVDELGRASERNAHLSQRDRQQVEIIADQRTRNRVLAVAVGLLLLFCTMLGLLTRHIWTINRRLKLKNMVIRRQGQEISAKNMALKQQNMRLSEALMNEEEKEMVIKEIHHRVKNNLQVVDSLLSIEGDHSADPRVARQLRDAQGRIRSMALVHDHIYRSNGGKGSLEQHLQELARNVLAMHSVHDRVSVTVSSDRTSFPEDIQMPLTLLVNELLTNALKHAFADGRPGHIRIRIRTVDNGFELTFTDNGPAWTVPEASSETHFGLHLIEILAEQLDGTIQRTHNEGNVFRLRFGMPAVLRKVS